MSSLPLAVTTSVAALVGGFFAWNIKSEQKRLRDSKEKELNEVVHLIKVADIAALLHSEDEKVKKSAEQLLIERASKKENLGNILKKSVCDDMEEVVKGVTAINLISKSSDENKAKLLEMDTLSVLTEVLRKMSNDFNYQQLMDKCKKDFIVEKILNRTIASIFQLTLHDTVTTLNFCKEASCIRDIFLNILGDHGYHISTDVKRWSTFIVHQLAQCDLNPIKKSLRKWGIIRKATFCLIKTLGDILQTQLCLQILVQYLNDSVEEIVQVCQEMATLGLMPHLVGLLRCDEEETVIQLSAVILHHFCCFDLETSRLSSLPGIIKTLFTVLNSTDANIQKTILRICNYLAVGSTKFRRQITNYKPMIAKLSICLASGNADVVYGSLMIIHDLAMPGKHAVEKLIQANNEIIKSLVTLSLSSQGETVQLIAETLGFICSCESLHSLILKHGVVNAILHFAKSGDTAVQFWASALLLNLSMISDDIKETIIRSGGIHILLEMAVSDDETELPDIATNATKTLVILGFLDSVINIQLVSGKEGSIIIDGTEHCPEKPGINLVSLDFVHYKYSKGYVVQPDEFPAFLKNHIESSKADPLFAVTQGDCAISAATGEEFSGRLGEFFKFIQKEMFPFSSWKLILTFPTWLLASVKTANWESGEKYGHVIPMKDLVSTVLKDNFTDPLIDVLLSMPPSSNISKIEELELIEILARHSFQRRNIISTVGFLDYLNELVWSVASMNSLNYTDPENSVKVSQCVAALRILHACSIDKSSVDELIDHGTLRAITSLLLSIVPSLTSRQFSSGSTGSYIKFSDSEQKPAWFDLVESSKENKVEDNVKDLMEDFDEAVLNETCYTDMLYAAHLGKLDTEITDSNDDLFDIPGHENVGNNGRSRVRTVTYADTVEYITEDTLDGNESHDNSHSNRTKSRMRADSFIVRSDSRNSRLERRAPSVLDESGPVEPVNELPLMSPKRSSRPISADHQQMRRISRSMSTSLQQSKSTDEIKDLVNIDEVLQQLVKHSAIILYHVVQHVDEQKRNEILLSNIIPLMLNIVGCLTGSLKQRVGLTLSSSVVHVSNAVQGNGTDNKTCEDVSVQHCSYPSSCIISSHGLEVSNENWFFETVRGNQCISKSQYPDTCKPTTGWYYEVKVITEGILQIGWANEDCNLNPEKGIGVGDNFDSCGYDGARCKIWNGPSRDLVQNNDYGIEWQSGDIVSVLLSWDGDLSFWLNGKDLGPTNRKLDTNRQWFPAVSLSVDQHCVFLFKESSLRHLPPVGYSTISQVASKTSISLPRSSKSVGNQIDIGDISTTHENPEQPIHLMFYYEFEKTLCADLTKFDLGYIRVDTASLETSTTSQKLLVTLSKEVFKNAAVIGCGIVVPTHEMMITKDGEKIFQKPISTLFPNIRLNNNDLLLQLIPYVSLHSIQINFGQNNFVYEHANAVLSKHNNLEFMRTLIDKIDK